MRKKILAILLAAALILVGFASCRKKKSGTDGDNEDFIQNNEIIDFVLVESRDAGGNAQKDANGNQIYDRFTFKNIDDESVEITKYEPQIIGSQQVVDDKTVISYIRCYTAHMVIIPNAIDGKRVARIGEEVFKGSTDLNAVVIPETVTEIGANAFAQCSALASLTLPASVATIGNSAFYGCSKLATLTFAASSALETIPTSAFQNCPALTAVNIPAYIKTIGRGAFLGCSAIATLTVAEGTATIEAQAFQGLAALTTVSLPASVTAMGELNFYGCEALTAAGVTVPAGSVAAQYMTRVLAGDVPTEPIPAPENA